MAGAADELKQVPLFNSLNQRQLRRLAGKVKERTFKAGTSVVQEGKMSGIGFFIVTDGLASVVVGGNEVATIGPGDHFGELALIAERERTATVTAQTALECLELDVVGLPRVRPERSGCLVEAAPARREGPARALELGSRLTDAQGSISGGRSVGAGSSAAATSSSAASSRLDE